ncbi:iron transporter, partial [Proteus sp. fly-1067]
MRLVYKAAVSSLALFSITAFAQEYPLGQPIIKNGMEIQGVYLQPITMDTEEGHHAISHLSADKADIHL